VKSGPCPAFARYILAFALQLREKHGKTSSGTENPVMQFLNHSKTSTSHVSYCTWQSHWEPHENGTSCSPANQILPAHKGGVCFECTGIFITKVSKYANKISYVPVVKHDPSIHPTALESNLGLPKFLLSNCSILPSQLPVATLVKSGSIFLYTVLPFKLGPHPWSTVNEVTNQGFFWYMAQRVFFMCPTHLVSWI